MFPHYERVSSHAFDQKSFVCIYALQIEILWMQGFWEQRHISVIVKTHNKFCYCCHFVLHLFRCGSNLGKNHHLRSCNVQLQVDSLRYLLIGCGPLATQDAVGLAHVLHRHHLSNDFFVVEDGCNQEVTSICSCLRRVKLMVHEGLHFD